MKRAVKSKKGDVEFTLISVFITVVVLGFILLSFLSKINAMGAALTYEKKFLATDMAVSIDKLHGIPSNAYLLYSDLGKFNLSYSLGPSIIEVYTGSDIAKDASKGFFYFIEDGPKGIFLRHKELKPANSTIRSIFISKQGNDILFDSPQLNPKFKTNLNYLSCPKKISPVKSIVIDPGHGWDDASQKGEKGFISPGNNSESVFALELANMLRGTLSRIAAVESTRGWSNDSSIPMAQKISAARAADGIISIHLGGNADLSVNNALAYFNVHSIKKEESIRLGCNILNALSDVFPQITGLAVVPINLDNAAKINPESPYSILLEDKVAVLLELGNIQMPLPNFMLEQNSQIEISKAALEGVERYNGKAR